MRARSTLAQGLATVLALASLAQDAHAAEPQDARLARGAALAAQHCAKCHAIGKTDASPTRANANTAFRMLHERYPIEMLVEAAKTGSISGHDEMPGFDFSDDDITALLLYIDSLNPGTPGYITSAPR